MNPIHNALTQGYSNQNILQFLLRHFPHAKNKIEKALAQGFSADKIVKFLSGGRKEVNQPVTEHEQARFSHKEKQRNLEKNIVKGGLALGGTALGGYALSRALPRAGQALTGQILPALPQGPLQIGQQARPQLPAPGQAAMQPPPPMQPQGPPAHFNPTAQNRPIPQANAPIAPQEQPIQAQPQSPTPAPIVEPSAPIAPLPKKLQDMANGMLRAEKSQSPEEISNALKKLSPREAKDYEKNSGQTITRAVEDLASKTNIQAQQPATPSPMVGEEEKAPVSMDQEQPVIEPSKETVVSKKEKGSTVALPSGEIGEISDIRQGIATVNANGKEYRRKVEELEEEPEDVVETVQSLLKIPEVDKSSIVSLFTFDPEEKKMYIQFHNGESYKYLDVDPEKVRKIADKMGIPVTQGKNIFGAWSPQDKKSLGATLIKEIIGDPKYAKPKKGEKPNPNYTQLETLYDYWEKLRKKPKRKGL